MGAFAFSGFVSDLDEARASTVGFDDIIPKPIAPSRLVPLVEAHLANGLPSLALVGLPEAAVKESKDRGRSAIQNSGFDFPTRKITLNLAPADLPKNGGRFDLAIALGVLVLFWYVTAMFVVLQS